MPAWLGTAAFSRQSSGRLKRVFAFILVAVEKGRGSRAAAAAAVEKAMTKDLHWLPGTR